MIGGPHGGAELKRTVDSWIKIAVVMSGILIPWCIGVGMKLHLDRLGEPTWDWAYFFHPRSLLTELWATFWFAAPSLALALLAHYLLAGRIARLDFLVASEKRVVVLASAAWGGLQSVPVFLDIFRNLDPIIFLLSFYVAGVYVGHYLTGLLAGLALALASAGLRRLRRKA